MDPNELVAAEDPLPFQGADELLQVPKVNLEPEFDESGNKTWRTVVRVVKSHGESGPPNTWHVWPGRPLAWVFVMFTRLLMLAPTLSVVSLLRLIMQCRSRPLFHIYPGPASIRSFAPCTAQA